LAYLLVRVLDEKGEAVGPWAGSLTVDQIATWFVQAVGWAMASA